MTALVDEVAWSEATADDTAAPTTAGVSMGVAMAAAASAGAGLVHAGAAGSHNGTRQLALLFALTAVAQLAASAFASLRSRRLSVATLAAVNVAAMTAWLYTRNAAVSFVDGLEEVQDIELADASAAALAAVAAVFAAGALARGLRGRAAGPALGSIVAVAGLLVAVPGMTAPHGHEEAEHADGTAVHASEQEEASAVEQAGPVLGVALPDVQGVTDEQRLRAATLIRDTRAALVKFSDTGAAEAAGFVSIGDGRTGFEHFVNRAYLANEAVLDPNEPESLVFKVGSDGSRTLASAMYILPPGKTMADVPDVAGPMTQWHDHQNLCWDATGTRLAGILVNGQCRPGGTFRPTPPMLHVWVTEHPCGPFAGIEGSAHTGACHATDAH